MKKIYFFDIDNTLLDHQTYQIPPSALSAIKDLQLAGHTIIVATGRSFVHAEEYIKLIAPSYAITQNGARILQCVQAAKSAEATNSDHKKERFIEVFGAPLARAALADLFSWMLAQGHQFGTNQGDFGHVSAATPDVLNALSSVKLSFSPDTESHLHENVYQGWLFFDESLDSTLFPEILQRYPEFALVRWHQKAIDVMPKNINKWTACQWVMEKTHFRPEQAIAFGDGRNDIEMLQGVGLGIAMDNGHPALKAIANRIAPALDQNGIASMLETLSKEAQLGA